MNRNLALLGSLVLVALCAGLAFAEERPVMSRIDARFELLKSLAGEWEGKAMDGSAARVTYRVTAAGSAIEEVIDSGTEHEMITMYHMDGDNLMMTHYCAARNQPRMRAKPLDVGSKTLTFAFVDATNLAKPTDGHMSGLVLAIQDADHITQNWAWSADGKEQVHDFSFARKKS